MDHNKLTKQKMDKKYIIGACIGAGILLVGAAAGSIVTYTLTRAKYKSEIANYQEQTALMGDIIKHHISPPGETELERFVREATEAVEKLEKE